MADGFLGSLVALAMSLGPPVAGQAPSQTFGSPLKADPNLAIGCESRPALADDGGTGNYYLGPSNQRDCTWRQSGVFGVPSDPRFSSVPASGRITRVAVRSGPRPAPLRVVIMRQYAHPQFERGCCFFVAESRALQPRPNAISTVAVDLPVKREYTSGVLVVDLVGISGESGKGTLPLHSTGRNNAFSLTEQGSVNAGFFYPRQGALPNDGGGGRPEEGIPGVEVLMQWTWSAS
jgi:hypothetical protein